MATYEHGRQKPASSLYGKLFVRERPSGAVARDLSADLGAASVVRAGVRAAAVDEVVAAGVVDAGEVYDVILPRRTLAHRKAKGQRLTPEESDRLARVLRVAARAEEALGDAERGHRWLRKPNRALGGGTPMELLASEAGARAVEKVLGRIEHGVFS